MSSLNRATLIGNLGKDPEIRATRDGREIANLSIATTEAWKDKNSGERKERVEWHRVSIFNEGLVGVAKKYLHKGSKVMLEGQIQTRKWTDQQGVEKYSTEIVLQGYDSKLIMLDGKREGGSSQRNDSDDGYDDDSSSVTAAPRNSPIPELDDEIPF